ncbi:hypothetical protein B0H19DRAFT_1143556, partial [Mycena capillaripes]
MLRLTCLPYGRKTRVKRPGTLKPQGRRVCNHQRPRLIPDPRHRNRVFERRSNRSL